MNPEQTFANKVALVTGAGKNIGMGYVPISHAQPGTRIVIDCRGKPAQAEVVKGPFYRRPGA